MNVLDIIIVVSILLVILWVGFNSGRNVKTFKEYAIGNRNFSDFAIFCTITATLIGGNAVIGCAGKVYDIGLIHLLAAMSAPLAYAIVGVFAATRIKKFYGCVSLGDVFSFGYSSTGRFVAGLLSFIYTSFGISIQFSVMGLIFSNLTGWSYNTCVIISAGVLLVYTMKGGVKAVTLTDVLQFILLVTTIPLIVTLAVVKIGGFPKLFASVPASHLQIIGNENFFRYLLLAIAFTIPTINPSTAQRLLMTKNEGQGLRAFMGTSIFYILTIFMVAIIGLASLVLYPDLSRTDQAFPRLIQDLLPIGLKGFAISGLLAIFMSSADSDLNSGSIVFANDIFTLLNKDYEKASETQRLKLVRCVTYLLGGIAMFIAIYLQKIFEILVITRSLWFSTVLIPMYFLIFNRKISVKGFVLSVVSGLTVLFLWNYFIKPGTKIDGLFPGFFANLFVFLFFYFHDGRRKVFQNLQHEGLVYVLQQDRRAPVLSEAYQLRTNLLLGIFLLVTQVLPMFFMQQPTTRCKVFLSFFNGIMAAGLIFGPQFPVFYKKHFSWFRELTLLVCLPISSIVMIFTAENGCLHLLTFGLALTLLLILGDKKYRPFNLGFISCSFVGVLVACLVSTQSFTMPQEIHLFHILYVLSYLLMLVLVWHSIRVSELLIMEERYRLARSVSHDLITPMLVQKMILTKKNLNELSEDQKKLLFDSVKEMFGIVDAIVPSSMDKIVLSSECLNDLIQHSIAQKQYIHKHISIHFNADEVINAPIHSIGLSRIIANLIHTCVEASGGQSDLLIQLKRDDAGHPQITFRSNMSIKSLDQVFNQFQKTSKEVGLGLSFLELQQEVELLNGTLTLDSSNSEDVALIITLLV